MLDLLLVSFVGALISLDRTAFLQIMISQPIVAGTLVGLSLGDPFTGLTVGSVLELLWIGAVPIGSYVPPNETVAAVIATSVSVIAGREMGLINASLIPLMVFSILVCIPLAVFGQRVDVYVRNYNKRFALNADRLLESGDLLYIGRENLKGLFSFFTASFFSILLLLALGLYLTKKVYPIIPEQVVRGFPYAFYLLVSLGIAVSIRTANGKRMLTVFSAGFLLGLVIVYLKV